MSVSHFYEYEETHANNDSVSTKEVNAGCEEQIPSETTTLTAKPTAILSKNVHGMVILTISL